MTFSELDIIVLRICKHASIVVQQWPQGAQVFTLKGGDGKKIDSQRPRNSLGHCVHPEGHS